MIRTPTLPRLAPSTVRRSRLERWLSTHASMPLRLLIAPAGCGKTTAVLKYLPHSEIDAGYCALPEDCNAAGLREAIARGLALAPVPDSYEALTEALRGAVTVPTELVVDDADNAAADAIALLGRLFEDAPASLTFVYCLRSRAELDAKQWIARGLAVLCDARRLAFDPAEVGLLAEACGVPYTHVDIGRLVEESDGWAVVVSGAIRSAAEDERSLSDAYEQWRNRYGQFFTEFIAADLDRASEEDRALVRSIIAGAACDDEDRLQRLEMQGLFVVNESGVRRPFRAIRLLRSGRGRLIPSARFAPMVVRMFARFSAEIDGHEIEWVRRRDQQLVKYLLLKPTGSATRGELAATFWPDADKHLAAQSVRTACSNIRKALAKVVGYAAVDLYFRADPDVCIDLSNVVADVRRFAAHAGDGDADFDRGDLKEAAVHYRAADELYTGRLLDGDVPEPWFAAQAQLLEDRCAFVLERLAEAAFEDGDLPAASQYALRAQKIHPEQPGIVRLLARVSSQHRAAPTDPSSLDERRRRRTSA